MSAKVKNDDSQRNILSWIFDEFTSRDIFLQNNNNTTQRRGGKG